MEEMVRREKMGGEDMDRWVGKGGGREGKEKGKSNFVQLTQ